MATNPVTVQCIREFDPPRIYVTIANLQTFSVDTATYEYLREQLGWPANPCAGIGD